MYALTRSLTYPSVEFDGASERTAGATADIPFKDVVSHEVHPKHTIIRNIPPIPNVWEYEARHARSFSTQTQASIDPNSCASTQTVSLDGTLDGRASGQSDNTRIGLAAFESLPQDRYYSMCRYLTDQSERLTLDKHYGKADHGDRNMHHPLHRRRTHTWDRGPLLDGRDPANIQRKFNATACEAVRSAIQNFNHEAVFDEHEDDFEDTRSPY